ncbi:MAG: PHB depolymerase family esterase [Myxococcales bacterium]
MRILLLVLPACVATAPAARFPATPRQEPVRPSFGCRAPQPIVQGDRTLTSDGRTRRFRLVVPESARKGPAPLVLNIHGLAETPALHEYYTAMDARAAERGMVVAYPQGIHNSWNAGNCCGRAMDEKVDDVRFLRDLVREIESEICIDRARVYATGMSNGAILSYRLACEASDVFAAIAPVAGTDAFSDCRPKRPVAVLAFNGTSDLLVRWEGSWSDLVPAHETVATWRERNRCSAQAATVYRQGDATCEAPRCAADTISCVIDGGGHTWPGAIVFPLLGHTSNDVDSTATILDFFLDHPLQRPQTSGRGLQARDQSPARSASTIRSEN